MSTKDYGEKIRHYFGKWYSLQHLSLHLPDSVAKSLLAFTKSLAPPNESEFYPIIPSLIEFAPKEYGWPGHYLWMCHRDFIILFAERYKNILTITEIDNEIYVCAHNPRPRL